MFPLTVIILIGVFGCSPRIYDKEKLSLVNEPFQKADITFRTDGYYYRIEDYEKGEDSALTMEYGKTKLCAITPIIFYGDGFVRKSTFIHGIRPYKTLQEKNDSIKASLLDIDKSIINNTFHVKIENTPWDWGLYRQNGREVSIQYYYNRYGNYRLREYGGEALNDTTLVFRYEKEFTDPPGYSDETEEEPEEIYHFRSLSVKPDSSNYIKSNIQEFGRQKRN